MISFYEYNEKRRETLNTVSLPRTLHESGVCLDTSESTTQTSETKTLFNANIVL